MKDEYGVDITYLKAHRSIEGARGQTFGFYNESYDQLRCTASGAGDESIREAVSTESKHYPPCLDDEVCRLEKIAKDGRSHQKLNESRIYSVGDFLRFLKGGAHIWNADHRFNLSLLPMEYPRATIICVSEFIRITPLEISSIGAFVKLNWQDADITINWVGGLHHERSVGVLLC
ncbi:hypothetical protein ACS0TY_034482 [Phlomoides rotata]